MKNDQHVVPNPKGGWSVVRSGATRATRVFTSQQDALSFAKSLAEKERAELYIHRRDGTIQEKGSYRQGPGRAPHQR